MPRRAHLRRSTTQGSPITRRQPTSIKLAISEGLSPLPLRNRASRRTATSIQKGPKNSRNKIPPTFPAEPPKTTTKKHTYLTKIRESIFGHKKAEKRNNKTIPSSTRKRDSHFTIDLVYYRSMNFMILWHFSENKKIGRSLSSEKVTKVRDTQKL